ncbi:MAG: hypothetical protein IPJ83_04395 [Saprospiraceae bacterium]|nr:hypothetical protein [Candidatus Vicinibacter proximus]
MTKVLQKAGFVGETIYVGIDVHLKSWNVSLYYGSQYLRSFHQSPHPDILVSFLQREFLEQITVVPMRLVLVVIG